MLTTILDIGMTIKEKRSGCAVALVGCIVYLLAVLRFFFASCTRICIKVLCLVYNNSAEFVCSRFLIRVYILALRHF